MIDLNLIAQKVLEQILLYAPKVLYALLTLVIGWWIIKILTRTIDKFMERRKVDISLRPFLKSIISITLKILLIISAISMLGIKMTGFIAIIGAAGLAIGLALQGSLSNFAGGVLILLFKPFKVGDVVEMKGFTGKVDSIQLLNTIMKTFDNKTIVLPNGPVANSDIINYSAEENRRVDMKFSISYSDNFEKAKKILKKMIAKDKRVFDDPEPFIRMTELADSSLNITVRMWCKTSDYWSIYHDLIEGVKKEFDKNKISIPFPQRDVHLYKH